MWAVVGLGNPGDKYSGSRHNVGFMAIDAIASAHGINFTEKRLYSIGKGSIEGVDVVLVEPLTFMNRSGLAARDILDRHAIGPENLIVVHDDLDMETGKLKIKRGGSSGGHKGVESIIQCLGNYDFVRVKIGIGRDPDMPAEDYVLRKFKRAELPVVKEAIVIASEAVSAILFEGVEKAMNRYNRRPAA